MVTPLVSITRHSNIRGSEKAREFMATSRPVSPDLHLFESGHGRHGLVVNGSRIFEFNDDVYSALSKAVEDPDVGAVGRELAQHGLDTASFINDEAPSSLPIHALSLAVAQKCNLGCTYCYAREGDFGESPKNMPLDVALRTVDLLFADVGQGESVNLSFLGGEPLANRAVLHSATEKASEIGRLKGVNVTFSVTTNATLLTPSDHEFFEEHAFAVTVSLDGIGEVHDRLRPLKSGAGSYERIITNISPMLAAQRRMQVSARVTVTPQNLRLSETLDEFVQMGFHSVGFSPMLSSPTGRGELSAPELEVMLEEMIGCGERFERHVAGGRRYPFLNMVNAMREIHRGTHRPYPCGAGAGYLGVSADGDLFACHRFVGDERAIMGSVINGVDTGRQKQWLEDRHVHYQEPCNSCWARYMCGGGCHHEVINRGRTSCDYIRGWLHYCLEAYIRLSEQRPDYFGMTALAG